MRDCKRAFTFVAEWLVGVLKRQWIRK